MTFPARYADGRSALAHDAACEIGEEQIAIHAGASCYIWRFEDVRRADDGNGLLVLKLRPDSGERLTLDAEAIPLLRAAAPDLFTSRAQGAEGAVTVTAVAAGAWSLAAASLLGVPMLAGPIADALPNSFRNKISNIAWSQVHAFGSECADTSKASEIVNAAAYGMMRAARVASAEEIHVSIIDANFANAFALPDGAIVLTDEMIAATEAPDELLGVIAHEVAHIEHNHVMKSIVRSVGAGIFFDIVFGGAGAGQAIALASVNLSSLQYSREDEIAADAAGLDYLDAAGIDPGGVARLFDRLGADEPQGGPGAAELLSTHPATAARAAAARRRARPELTAPIGAEDWAIVRNICGRAGEPALTGPQATPPGPARPD